MPIAKKKDIPQDFLDQIQTNLKKDNNTVTSSEAPVKAQTGVTPAAAPVNNVTVTSEDKKEKYADVMNVRLSKGRRNEIKTFCTSCGVSVTQYIESSYEFLAKEVAAGNIVISKGGITKVEN